MSLADRVEAVRDHGPRRWGVALVGAIIGVALATTHWLGFLVGGALVAVPQRTIPRGVVAGTAFGVVVWGAFLVTLVLDGTAAAYVGMGQVFYLSVAIPVVAAFLGSLVRAFG
ncbi:MAG TPA: hypothetical protein VJ898_13700 [Natrialbaceae archaeon]|nr:hypothetical protein [Natrialbaceae archaeon]